MNIRRYQLIIEDRRGDDKQNIKRIGRHNTNVENQYYSQNNNRIVDLNIEFEIPNIRVPNPCFGAVQQNLFIPRPPRQFNSKLKFPIYHKMFNSIYYLIGKPNQGIWNDFAAAYRKVMEENKQQELLTNLSSLKKLQNLQAFIHNGMQVRLIIENLQLNNNYTRQDQQNLIDLHRMIQKKQIIQIYATEKQSKYFQNINFNKKIEVRQIRKLFYKYIQRNISKSCKSKIHYNFVSIQSKSSQAIQRKNLIQKCLQPTQKQQCMQNHQNFTTMMETYENKKCLREIERLEQSTKPNKQQLIIKVEQLIGQIQKQQKKFCDQFQDWLVLKYPFQGIQKQSQKERIYFQIIKEYTQQHSIYQVLNNNIRLSLCINQKIIKWLSPFIRYFYEAVRHFFLKQMAQQDFSNKKLFRAALMPIEQLSGLQEGKFLFNIGFMSTSKSQIVAKSFHNTNKYNYPDNAYMFFISFNEYYKNEQYFDNQQGFLDVTKQHRRNATQDKMGEEQIIFNPLNIFKIIAIDKKQKVIHMEYAAHIKLMAKMKNGMLIAQQKLEFDQIFSKITALKRSNYDKGRILIQKGQTTQAIKYYEQAEQVGQITVEQKLNKFEALQKMKDFDSLQKELQQLTKKQQNQKKIMEERLQQIKKSQNKNAKFWQQQKQKQKIIIQQKQQEKLNKILRLTKQSELLQLTSDFHKAEEKAVQAMKKSSQLSKQIQVKLSKGKKISSRQILKSLQVNIKTTLQVSKSRFEKNKYKESICNSYVGFKLIDQFYQIFSNKIFPKIQSLIQKENIPIKQQKLKNLLELKRLPLLNEFEKQRMQKYRIDLKKIDEHKDNHNDIIKNIFKQQQMDKQKQKCDQYKKEKQSFIAQYYDKRVIDKRLVLFYNAAKQIEYLTCSTLSLKTIKNLLTELKQNIDSLLQYQKDYYDIMVQNLKAYNLDITSCMKSQKKTYYDQRFTKIYEIQKFQNQSTMSQSLIDKQLNTNQIDKFSRYATFLLEYSDLQRNDSKLQSNKGLKIIDNLKKHVNQQSQNNNLQLTSQKTKITQSKINYYKKFYTEQQILERAATFQSTRSASTAAQTIKTIGGSQAKNKQIYSKIKQTLAELQQIHKEDSKINKFYYLLTDINDQIEMFNNSYAVADRYDEELITAKQKIQNFKSVFKQKLTQQINKKNQLIAEFYFKDAQNALRRGYYLESQKKLHQSKKMLKKIYGEDLQLFARPVSIQCFRLEAEIVGSYGQTKQKNKFLTNIKILKQYIQKFIPNPNIQALINQAFAFVSVRFLPQKITEDYLLKAEQAIQSLYKSIKLRKDQLGPDNQFLAIAYSYLVEIEAKKQPISDIIEEYYAKGKNIMKNLECQMEHSPMLYLHLMKMKVAYLQKYKKQNIGQIPKIYKENMDSFIKQKKGLRSITYAEDMIKAGQYLIHKKGYMKQSETYLKEAQTDIDIITDKNVNEQNNKNTNKILSLFQYNILLTLIDYYREHGNTQQKRLYKKKKQQLEQVIYKPGRRPKAPPSFSDFVLEWFGKCTGLQ